MVGFQLRKFEKHFLGNIFLNQDISIKDRQLLIRGVWLRVHLSRVNFITVMYI